MMTASYIPSPQKKATHSYVQAKKKASTTAAAAAMFFSSASVFGACVPEEQTQPPAIKNITVQLPNGIIKRIKINSKGVYEFFGDMTKPAMAAEVLELNVESLEEIVNQAKKSLGLNAQMIARFVGVSRPTLYNHIRQPEQVKDSTMDGYEKLEKLLTSIDREVNGSIKDGLKSVFVDSRTLLSRLRDEDFDQAEFIVAANAVAKTMAKRTPASIPRDIQSKVISGLGNMG